MAANLNPIITAFEAQAAANGLLLDHLPDRFLAVNPRLDSTGQIWRVSVVLTYPRIGSVGEAGEIKVSAFSDVIVSHTPLDEMKATALKLYEQNREAIQAAFLQTRNG